MSPIGAVAVVQFVDQVDQQPIDPRLDPEIRVIAEAAARSGGLPADMTEKRRAFDRVFQDLGGVAEPVDRVEDFTVPGDGGPIPVRLYRPAGERLPVVVYYHGGGFEKGGLASHDAPLRRLANRCGCAVLSVAYRLAPEHAYPAQPDDAYSALLWAASQGEARGLDPKRIAVAGDSVGGNLAAVTALRARARNGPSLKLQVLLYPVTDLSLSSESWRRFAKGPWLSLDYERNALQQQYLRGGDPRDPAVSPLFADPRGLPAAFVVDAEFDGYRDEGQAYAARLRETGVPVEARVYPGMIHDFFLMTGRSGVARKLVDDIARALQRAFGTAR